MFKGFTGRGLSAALPAHRRLAHRQAAARPIADGRVRGGARRGRTGSRSRAASTPSSSRATCSTRRPRRPRPRSSSTTSSPGSIPERIACVVIAGNHDHPRKLAALASLLEGLGIHIRAEVRPPGQGGVVALRSRDGKEEARVAVLPFVPERKIVDACPVMGPEHGWYEAYAARIEQILHFLTRDLTADTVNLVRRPPAGVRGAVGDRRAASSTSARSTGSTPSSFPATSSTSPSATCTGRRSSWRPPRPATPARSSSSTSASASRTSAW